MEQIAQEQLNLLARKAQLQDELKAIETKLGQLAAFAQGYQSAQPKEEAPTEEE